MKINNNESINLKPPADILEKLKLQEAGKKLESVFITQLVKAMEKTIPRDENNGGSKLSEMLFSSTMGKAIADKGGIGLADFIYKELSQKANISKWNIKKIDESLNIYDLYKVKQGVIKDES
jgi:Rod binding domain-containing protein